MEDLISTFRSLTKLFTETDDFEKELAEFKAIKTELSGLDDIVKDMPIELNSTNFAEVNGVELRELENTIRTGNINEFLESAKITSSIPKSVENNIKDIIKTETEIPDIDIEDLVNKIDQAKKYHSDLDVSVGDSVEEFKAKLSDETKGKLEKLWDAATSKFGRGAKVVGVVAVLVLGTDLYSNLYQATKARNGCKLLCKMENKTTSTDLSNRFCKSGTTVKGSGYIGNITLSYNINIYVTYAVNKDSSLLEKINNYTKLSITKDNYKNIISDPKNWTILTEFYKKNQITIAEDELCSLYAISNECIACDPDQSDLSDVRYIDSSVLPNNYTIRCINDSTIIGTIIDTIPNLLPSDISVLKIGKYLLIGIALLLCLTFIKFIIRFFNKL